MINQGIERIRLLLTELEEDRVRISQKADDLKQAIDAVTDASTELGGGEDFQSPFGLGQRLTIGIPNIEKKNDEAVFDAMAEFNKMCPYCGKNQYHLGYRDKIEIDHFFPVSKGGQHVPWNILPVCKDCNRRKRDKNPRDFLPADIFRKCQEYLTKVQKRYLDEGIHQFETSIKLRALIDENSEFIQKNASENFISELLHLYYPEKLLQINNSKNEISVFNDREDIIEVLKNMILNQEGEFEGGVVMGPWQDVCIRLNKYLPDGKNPVTPGNLFSALKISKWIDIGMVGSRDTPTKKRAFCTKEVAKMSRSEIRRLGERILASKGISSS